MLSRLALHIPSYDANAPRLVDAADRLMANLLKVYPRTGPEPAREKLPKTLTRQLQALARSTSEIPETPTRSTAR